MTKESSLTGALMVDAPALARKLLKLLSADQYQAVEASWRKALHSDTCEIQGLSRHSSSFNPRPARVIALLFETDSTVDFQLIMAAFCLGSGHAFEGCYNQIATDSSCGKADHSDLPELTLEQRHNLHLADLLDRVRHLHQCDISNLQREKLLKSIGQTLKTTTDSHPLKVKLLHTLKRLK